MKIIKRGKLPSQKKWRGTCRQCKTIVEALQEELSVTSDQRDGEIGTANCPVCKTQMFFYPLEKSK